MSLFEVANCELKISAVNAQLEAHICDLKSWRDIGNETLGYCLWRTSEDARAYILAARQVCWRERSGSLHCACFASLRSG